MFDNAIDSDGVFILHGDDPLFAFFYLGSAADPPLKLTPSIQEGRNPIRNPLLATNLLQDDLPCLIPFLFGDVVGR
jgi:hypothetical protein